MRIVLVSLALTAAAALGGEPFWTEAEPGGAEVPTSFARVAELATPAVVAISRPVAELETHTHASGFSVGDGYIVTVDDVVAESQSIEVQLRDGTAVEAKTVGRDAETRIALVRVVDPPASLAALALGDSGAVRPGDRVLVIGAPYGMAQSVVSGTVAATGRHASASPDENVIQIDGGLYPGTMGAPVLNADGHVVGIAGASRAGTESRPLGFAIPIERAKPILLALKEEGKVARGWLGVSFERVTQQLAKSLGLPDVRGAVVARVFPDSPAERAGLAPGDVVRRYRDEPVEDFGELRQAIGATPPGGSAALQVFRGGETVELRVTVGESEATDP